MVKCCLVLSVLGIILINRRLAIKGDKLKDKTEHEWDKRTEKNFLIIRTKFKDSPVSQDASTSINGYSDQVLQDESKKVYSKNYSSEYHMEKQKDFIVVKGNSTPLFPSIYNRSKASDYSEIENFPHLNNKKLLKRKVDNWNFTSDPINQPNTYDFERNYHIERATVSNNGNSYYSVKAAANNSVLLQSSINQSEELLHESNFRKSDSSTRKWSSNDNIVRPESSLNYDTGYQQLDIMNNNLSTYSSPRFYHPGIFRFEFPISTYKAPHILTKEIKRNQNQANAKLSRLRNNSDNLFKEKINHESNKRNLFVKKDDLKFETIPYQVKGNTMAQINRRTFNFSFPTDAINDYATYTAASHTTKADIYSTKMLRQTRKKKTPKEAAAFGRKTHSSFTSVSINDSTNHPNINESTYKMDTDIEENVVRAKHIRRRRPLARRLRKRKKMKMNSTTEEVNKNNTSIANLERKANEPRYSYSFRATGPKVAQTLNGLRTSKGNPKTRNMKPRNYTNHFSGDSEFMLHQSNTPSISPLTENETSKFTTHFSSFKKRFPKMRKTILSDKIASPLDMTEEYRRKSDFASTSNNNIKVIQLPSEQKNEALILKHLTAQKTRSAHKTIFPLSSQNLDQSISLNDGFQNKIRFSQSKNKSVEIMAPVRKYEFTRKQFSKQSEYKFNGKNNNQSVRPLQSRIIDKTIKKDTNSDFKLPKKSEVRSYDMYLLYSNSHPELMKEVNIYRRKYNTSTWTTNDSIINSTTKYPSYVLDLYHHLIGSDFLFLNGSKIRNNQPGFKSRNPAFLFNSTFNTSTNGIYKSIPITTSRISSKRTSNSLTYQQPGKYMHDSLENNGVKQLNEEVNNNYNQNKTNFSAIVNFKESFDVYTTNTIQNAIWTDNFSNNSQNWHPFPAVHTTTQRYAIGLNNSSNYSHNWHPFPLVRTTTRRYVAVTDI